MRRVDPSVAGWIAERGAWRIIAGRRATDTELTEAKLREEGDVSALESYRHAEEGFGCKCYRVS